MAAVPDSNGQPGGVAVYMRVSSDRGTVENQRPDLDRYLLAYNLSPYGWYEDEGVSGKWVPFGKRPQGRRLLADARAGHVALVLVWRLDRFGRNAYEILGAVNELEEAGARLVSLKEQFDTRTAAGRLMLGVLASVAEFEWASIMERSEAGVERKIADLGWMGGQRPYGYRVEGKRPNATLVPDETPFGDLCPAYPQLTPAGVVRLVFTLTVDDNLSTVAIADELNRRGVPTSFQLHGRQYKRGDTLRPVAGVWRPNAVNVLLSNPVYKGEFLWGRRAHGHGRNVPGNAAPRAVVTIPIPALVSAEMWDAAQAAMERHIIFSPRNAKHDYLLRGMVRCGACGVGYVGDRYRYVCYAARRPAILWGHELGKQHRCHNLPIRQDAIEAQIWADVEAWARDPDRLRGLLALKLADKSADADALRADLARTQQEQAAKQSERDSILAYFRKGRISEQDVDRQLDDIGREERDQAKRAADLAAELATVEDVSATLDAIDTKLRTLCARLDTEEQTPALRREIVELLVQDVTVRTEPGADGVPRAVAYVTYRFDAPQRPQMVIADSNLTRGRSLGTDWRSSERASAGRRD